MNIGQRSEVRQHAPLRAGHGSSRTWSRAINDQLYSFEAILMPSGERRYVVSKLNGYVGGPEFACAWDRVHFIRCTEDGE